MSLKRLFHTYPYPPPSLFTLSFITPSHFLIFILSSIPLTPFDNLQQVTPGSKAEQLGLLPGDCIVATSATAGDNMWTHDSDESVKSALNTR